MRSRLFPESVSKPEQPNASQVLCIGCGVCCDGTLHDDTELAPEDERAAVEQDFSLFSKDDRLAFRQPCPKFSQGKCRIYSERPHVCRAYRCKLLKDVENGRVDVALARERVETAKALASAIRIFSGEAVTPQSRKALWERLTDLSKNEGHAPKDSLTRAMLDLASLQFLLDAHFKNEKK